MIRFLPETPSLFIRLAAAGRLTVVDRAPNIPRRERTGPSTLNPDYIVNDTEMTRSHNADSTAALRHVGTWSYSAPFLLKLVVKGTSAGSSDHDLGTLTHPVYDAFAVSYSPRGDAVYAATGNQHFVGWGLEVWKAPRNGGTPTTLFSYRWAFDQILSVSEDGSEIMAAMTMATGTDTLNGGDPPFAHLHCVLEYRSTSSGALLDSIDLGENAIYPCYDSKVLTGSARRVAAGESLNVLGRPLLKLAHTP